MDRDTIAFEVFALIQLPGVQFSNKELYGRAFDLYRKLHELSFPDCYHVAVMEQQGTTDIVSFDQGFDRVPGVRRIEP